VSSGDICHLSSSIFCTVRNFSWQFSDMTQSGQHGLSYATREEKWKKKETVAVGNGESYDGRKRRELTEQSRV